MGQRTSETEKKKKKKKKDFNFPIPSANSSSDPVNVPPFFFIFNTVLVLPETPTSFHTLPYDWRLHLHGGKNGNGLDGSRNEYQHSVQTRIKGSKELQCLVEPPQQLACHRDISESRGEHKKVQEKPGHSFRQSWTRKAKISVD